MRFNYFDLDKKQRNQNISTVFPGFSEDEVVAVMSPHDDDAIIGAGYAMLAAKQAGADVYVVIFCKGDAGYSTVGEKETIVDVRREETYNCYEKLGVARDHVLRLEYPDFSALNYCGWFMADGSAGQMQTILQFLRDKKVTRVLIPNHYHEHIDHLAAHIMSSYDCPQSGDAALVDHGTPHTVKSTLQYSVWADLDPENALVNGRKTSLRANRIIEASTDCEQKVAGAIEQYISQKEIIKSLVAARRERKTVNNTYVEVYIAFDCRPKLDFAPYREVVEKFENDER